MIQSFLLYIFIGSFIISLGRVWSKSSRLSKNVSKCKSFTNMSLLIKYFHKTYLTVTSYYSNNFLIHLILAFHIYIQRFTFFVWESYLPYA